MTDQAAGDTGATGTTGATDTSNATERTKIPLQVQHPTGPHVVHFSAVKEVVEIESGRFEFFKQMIAVGLGGIAGLAAIFTERSKIPDEFLTRSTIIIFAISALVVVGWSAMGISTYANHLRDVDKLARKPEDSVLIKNRKESEEGILHHARVTLIAAFVGALALIAFAGLQLINPHPVGPEAAMETAQRLIRLQPGNPIPKSLDHFQLVGSDYIITYVTDQNKKYTVKVTTDKNEVSEIRP
jgi:hypothetical protein